MSNPHRKNARAVVYSRPWAEERVAEFINDYPRASHIFKKITNHDWDYPVELLRRDQLKWERYKYVIKALAKIDVKMGEPPLCKEYTQLIAELHLPTCIVKAKSHVLFGRE